jgi:site-specific DNA recombinase
MGYALSELTERAGKSPPGLTDIPSVQEVRDNALFLEDLCQAGCYRLLPVVTGCGGDQPGQIRDKSLLSRGGLGVVLCVLMAACVTATAAGGGCSGTQQTGRRVACIYARYSTRFQDSVDDQIRECQKWAEQNGYSVDPDLIFVDRGKSGRLRRRPSRMAIQTALEKGRFDVLVVFATSRLERNDYRIQQFVQEEIVERGKRAVFVMSNVDTDDPNWSLNLKVRGIVDSQQAKANSDHIRAGHAGLFLKGQVHGTITYGYKGVEIPGTQTRIGRPKRRYAIDQETSKWVKQVFDWYVRERVSRSGIVKRLNELRAPLPPRCTTGRWTALAVKGLLANARYRGLWQYGAKEAILLSGKDYIRQTPRAQALQEAQLDDLRIIDNETWFRAQELRADNPHSAGRKPVDGNRKIRPRLLNGLLYCGYHDRPLVAGGGQGRSAICPVCKEDGEGRLYTLLDRRLAVEMICLKIAELIQGDEAIVYRIVATCRKAADDEQRPDEGQIEDMKARRAKLSQQISYVLDLFAETDEDRRENNDKATELRRQRAGINAELAHLDAAANKPIKVPTPEEVQDLLAGLGTDLAEAVQSEDEAAVARVRRIIEIVTGGKILIYQAGPRQAQRGWLRGIFKVDVVKLVAEKLGIHGIGGDGIELEIEFRNRPIPEGIADEVKVLWDAGLKYTEISKRIGWNRNIVAKAVAFWHEARDLSVPDGRRHVGRLDRGPRLAERIADSVMELVDQKMPLTDIAKKFETSRNRITEAIRIWHEKRNLPVPDGRTLRKLRSKKRKSQR